MSITRHNKSNNVDWGIKTEGWPYVKISELIPGELYIMRGCFITPDNGYGRGAVLIEAAGSRLVNIPQRYVETIADIMSDPQDVAQIKAGKAGFRYSEFISEKFKRTGYDVEFVDL